MSNPTKHVDNLAKIIAITVVLLVVILYGGMMLLKSTEVSSEGFDKFDSAKQVREAGNASKEAKPE